MGSSYCEQENALDTKDLPYFSINIKNYTLLLSTKESCVLNFSKTFFSDSLKHSMVKFN